MFKKAFAGTFGVGCAIVVAIIALIVIGSALSAGSRSTTSTAPTTAPLGVTTTPAPGAAAAKQWVVVKQWEGNGAKDTETFTVSGEWRVDWANTGDNYLGVTIYDATTKFPVGLAANTTKQGADTSFQHKAGTYYLSINGSGGWKVDVQDMR